MNKYIQDEIVKNYLKSKIHFERIKINASNTEKNNSKYWDWNLEKICVKCGKTDGEIYDFRVLAHYDNNGWTIYNESEHFWMGNHNIYSCFMVIDLVLCMSCMEQTGWKYKPVMVFSAEYEELAAKTIQKYYLGYKTCKLLNNLGLYKDIIKIILDMLDYEKESDSECDSDSEWDSESD